MKSILTALILSMTSAVAIAQSPVQRQRQVPAKVKTQSTVQAVSSVGALAGGAGGGAAAASYAATGKVAAPTTINPADSTKNVAQRRRVEVLKSNKTGDPNAITLNPLYESQGLSGQNTAARSINESGVSVKSDSKPKKK